MQLWVCVYWLRSAGISVSRCGASKWKYILNRTEMLAWIVCVCVTRPVGNQTLFTQSHGWVVLHEDSGINTWVQLFACLALRDHYCNYSNCFKRKTAFFKMKRWEGYSILFEHACCRHVVNKWPKDRQWKQFGWACNNRVETKPCKHPHLAKGTSDRSTVITVKDMVTVRIIVVHQAGLTNRP